MEEYIIYIFSMFYFIFSKHIFFYEKSTSKIFVQQGSRNFNRLTTAKKKREKTRKSEILLEYFYDTKICSYLFYSYDLSFI